MKTLRLQCEIRVTAIVGDDLPEGEPAPRGLPTASQEITLTRITPVFQADFAPLAGTVHNLTTTHVKNMLAAAAGVLPDKLAYDTRRLCP